MRFDPTKDVAPCSAILMFGNIEDYRTAGVDRTLCIKAMPEREVESDSPSDSSGDDSQCADEDVIISSEQYPAELAEVEWACAKGPKGRLHLFSCGIYACGCPFAYARSGTWYLLCAKNLRGAGHLDVTNH